MEVTSGVQSHRISQPNCIKKLDYVCKLGMVIVAVTAIGTYLSWTSMGFDYLRKVHLVESVQQESWVGSLVPLGAIIGSLPVGVLSDKYGRKLIAWFSVLPLMIGWFMICFMHTTNAICGARFFAGLGCGAASIAIPIYFYELVNSYVKQRIVYFVYWFFNFGIFVPYNIYMTFQYQEDSKGVPFEGPQILLAGMMSFYSFFMIFLPESPMWLEDCGRKEDAEKAIKSLTGVYVTLNRTEPVKVTGNSGLRLSTYHSINNKKDIILILSFMTIQQFVGIGPLIFYLKDTIHYIVHEDFKPWVYAFIVTVPMIVAGCCNIKLHQWIGEKFLLIKSTSLMAITASILVGLAYPLQNRENVTAAGVYFAPVLLLMVYLIAFYIGLGPVPWIMIGKMFPSHSRKMVYNLAVTYSWALLFITTKTFQDMALYVEIHGLLIIYIFVNLAGMFLAIFLVPRRIKQAQEEYLENLDEVHTSIVS